VAEFKQGGTEVQFTVGAKRSPMGPISVAEFETLVCTVS